MKIKYYVNCFDEYLVIFFPKSYKEFERNIILFIEKASQEWHAADEIEDETTRQMVMDSDFYDYVMGRLTEKYSDWYDWEVRK